MGKFTVIPQATFDELQLDAGVLLKTFNPASPTAPADADIICATTGGINASCVPQFVDLGEDVDNCPNGMRELKKLSTWEAKMSFTALGTSPEFIKLSLGVADVSGATYALTSDVAINTSKTYYTRSGSSPNYTYTKVASPVVGSIGTYYEMTSPDYMITPRSDLEDTDFLNEVWWVGDRSDGGMVAIKMLNALSTGGLTIQTTKSGKGQISVEMSGHYSISAQKTVPMVFYSTEG